MDGGALRVPAPGKLNLMLRILGRRADGYHDLQTVFQFIDQCDWLTFRPNRSGEVVLQDGLPGVHPERNLILRAAKLLKGHADPAAGVEIELEKNLPMGGGLGGGSSDAATTLVVLNELWGVGLDQSSLMALGLQLGADVPVFIFGRGAWAEGVGDKLKPLELPEAWYTILVPPCSVATADVFHAPDLTRDNSPITITNFVAGSHENHCLDVVIRKHPMVGEAIAALREFSSDVRLTGTGACVYSIHDTQEEAETVGRALAGKWMVLVAAGRNRSPLYEVLEQRGIALHSFSWGVAKR